VFKNLKIPQPTLANLSEKEKKEIVDSMEMAVYGAILGAFIQGMQVSTNDTAGDWADGDLDHNKSVESAGVALGLMGRVACGLHLHLARGVYHSVR